MVLGTQEGGGLCFTSLHGLDHLLDEGYFIVGKIVLGIELTVYVCNALTPIDVTLGGEVLEGDELKDRCGYLHCTMSIVEQSPNKIRM